MSKAMCHKQQPPVVRHILTQQQLDTAALHFDATPEENGRRVLSMRQKDMQELFFTIYGVRTTSCNNVWLRNKLLQAAGLESGWRPPSAAKMPAAPAEPGDFSQYGRRRRAAARRSASERSSRREEGTGERQGQRDIKEEEQEEENSSADLDQPAARRRCARTASSVAASQAETSTAVETVKSSFAGRGSPSAAKSWTEVSALSRHSGSQVVTMLSMQAWMQTAAVHAPPPPALPIIQFAGGPLPNAALGVVPLPPSAQENSLAGLLEAPAAQQATWAPASGATGSHYGSYDSTCADAGDLISISAQLDSLYTDWQQGRVSFGSF
ncbi:hypothetical protein D9Q98_003326 [Chlorella vulgaris]|uniref:Uncharacterized protein n=1 Tax=Chlorella vulgaris TaxID=3077 RepID=A0A9D4TSS7_CHLVU|nr:hypothetical protein D9Q98_003326 [Chlorella vulgaris]